MEFEEEFRSIIHFPLLHESQNYDAISSSKAHLLHNHQLLIQKCFFFTFFSQKIVTTCLEIQEISSLFTCLFCEPSSSATFVSLKSIEIDAEGNKTFGFHSSWFSLLLTWSLGIFKKKGRWTKFRLWLLHSFYVLLRSSSSSTEWSLQWESASNHKKNLPFSKSISKKTRSKDIKCNEITSKREYLTLIIDWLCTNKKKSGLIFLTSILSLFFVHLKFFGSKLGAVGVKNWGFRGGGLFEFEWHRPTPVCSSVISHCSLSSSVMAFFAFALRVAL